MRRKSYIQKITKFIDKMRTNYWEEGDEPTPEPEEDWRELIIMKPADLMEFIAASLPVIDFENETAMMLSDTEEVPEGALAWVNGVWAQVFMQSRTIWEFLNNIPSASAKLEELMADTTLIGEGPYKAFDDKTHEIKMFEASDFGLKKMSVDVNTDWIFMNEGNPAINPEGKDYIVKVRYVK